MSNLVDLLRKLEKPIPRYTSYPTAPNWHPLDSSSYAARLKATSHNHEPLSLYFHLPFCQSMCLFCGCSVVLNRKEENEITYIDFLCKEISLVAKLLGSRKKVSQIHFGGGTPTKLSQKLLQKLFDHICFHFDIDFAGEIAIEIDPRTVASDQGEKLRFLRAIGFNRVSFGVQDTDEKVQEAIKRRQSKEVSEKTFFLAKEMGFQEINIDLIYGLPFQTVDTFQKTVEAICSWHPDRIALFSYAKIPWLKAHQKAIKDITLPSTEEKFRIYTLARSSFTQNGYTAIGMDHFALEKSSLAKSYCEHTLHRNFQGYTVQKADTMLGFGITAIGFLQNSYAQNCKELSYYYRALENGLLPMHRGKMLSHDDLIRKWVIEKVMCTFCVEKKEFGEIFGIDFDLYFAEINYCFYIQEGLLINTAEKLMVTQIGELFVRNIASCFDAYLTPNVNLQFSQSI